MRSKNIKLKKNKFNKKNKINKRNRINKKNKINKENKSIKKNKNVFKNNDIDKKNIDKNNINKNDINKNNIEQNNINNNNINKNNINNNNINKNNINNNNNINKNEKINLFMIKENKMDKTMKYLHNDFVNMLYPYNYSILIYKLTNKIINKTMNELKYKYITYLYTINNKFFYHIRSYTKLSLIFLIENYTHSLCIKHTQKEIYKKYKALLILKNFNNSESSEMKNYLFIIQNVLKNMFPNINLKKDSINKTKRIILYYYDSSNNLIYLRQYVLEEKQKLKHVLNDIHNKDISKYKDLLSYVKEKFNIKKENVNNNFNNNINLIEIGPRVTFKLYKIKDQDNVIYSNKN